MPRVVAVGVAGALVAASLSAMPVSAGVRLGAGPAATTARPGAQRTTAVAHPRVSSHALAPARALAPAVTTFNPATGSQGFGVFVQGNATLGATSTNGPVAMGGNLAIGSNFTVASQTAGTFTASGDAHPTGLLVGGGINWSGSNSGGALNVGSSAYVKVGNMTGSVIPANGGNPTHVSPTGSTYGSKPQVALSVAQPSASVTQSGLINFASAFSAFTSQSADMASCANSVTLTNSNGTPLSFPLSAGTNANVTLTPGAQNVLDISAANLANISTLTFNNSPTSTMPLIINVNTSGVSNNFSWTPGNFNGVQSSGVPYMLWNFSTATQVTIAGSSAVPGTIYAPGATVNDNDQNGLNGGIIAAAYAQGGISGSPNGGQVQYAPFAGTIQSCATPQLAVSLSASPSTAVPGGTVHYTVSVTNSGSAAYSAATFTDSLSGVLDDATYNSDASASSGSVSYTSPNLTWTGSLAVGAIATITFSATVNNPDTGDKNLVSTITSTSTGSNCASGSTDSRCSSTIPVSVLTMAVTASTPTANPGTTVSYTITVTNSGTVAVTGAAVSDSLSGVLDDASYNGDGTANAGSVTYTSPNLTWTGNLAAGAAATITFSVTVASPDTGNKILASTITSATAGSNCPAGSTDTRCANTVTVLAPGLTIALTTSAGTTTTPGAVVPYTVTVTNSGQTAYTGAALTDSLSGLLDDASYNANAAATAGSVTYSSPNLAWTGNLAVGATATITFSVTVNNPDTGDKVLASSITSATAGSNCAAGSTDSRCTSSVQVLVPRLAISVTAASATTTPGATVRYTVTVTNTGGTPYTGAAFTDPLADVLDDASYNGDATASAGSVAFASPNLSWTGNLAVGAAATITFSVTVNNPDTGNKILASTITSATAGSNCPAGTPAASCTATVNVAVLTIVNSAGVSSTTPGSVVRFTSTFTNSGQVPYTGITIASNITDVLDDATPNGDQTATSGTLSLTATGISWTGSIPVGGTVTITGTVTVNNPDTGNKVLASTLSTAAPGSDCPAGGTDPRCSFSVPVLIPALTITTTANTPTAAPGATVGYTVTVTNSGQTPYTGAAFTDSLAGALDDAAYNGNAAATAGSVTYSSPNLAWTGDLAVGATAVITFSVTVNSPDTGDKVLVTTIASGTVGSNCPPGGSNPSCTVTVAGITPALTITAAASPGTAVPGAVVHYTVTVTDSGQTPYTAANVSVSLAGVLDDAAYDGDATATGGSVSFTSPNLAWTGSLAVGATVTITYSATVNNPDTGDHILASTVTSASAGSNCPAGSTDPRCSATVPVSELVINSVFAQPSAAPGTEVSGTTTFTNTGQTPYTGITVNLTTANTGSQVIDVGNEVASSGTLSVGTTGAVWTGNVPVGGTVTITGSVIVASPYPPGSQVIAITDVTSAAGSNCPAGSTDPRCTQSFDVTIPGLTIVKTANTSVAVPGQVVGYTDTITNTGQTAYTGAVVTDSLAGVADDAGYNGNAAATAGSVSYTSPVLTWTGDLAPGASAVITYTVTVDNPDNGDKLLVNTVSSTATGSSCPPGSTSTACRVNVPVLTPALTIVATAATTSGSSAVAVPGGVVSYTVTVTNTGQTSYTGASLTDPLGGVLDDATYNNNAAANAGTVTFTSPDLTWTGDLAPGAAAVITFSVTVNNPDTGDQSLAGTVTSTTPGSNCPAGSADARCTVTVTVVGASTLTFTQTAAAASAVAGGTVIYTITIANSGASVYPGASLTDPLDGVLDDAVFSGTATASSGTVRYAAPVLSWAGDVPADGTVTITYSVTVNNPDTGNMILASTISSPSADSNCPAASPGPRCTATVTVSQLAIASTPGAPTVTPGGVVAETTTIVNTGQTPYFGISVDFSTANTTSQISDGGNETASSGTLSVGATGAVWTGDVPVGGIVTITGSIVIANPYPAGGQVIAITDATTAPGSNCPAGSTDPRCTLTVNVVIPGLTIVKTANATAAVPGQVIGYTDVITDSGQTSYAGAVVTDSFAAMADDAVYDGNATATAGSLSYASPVLTWTGDLSPGDSVTIAYTVTVNNPDTGDKLVITTASSAETGSTCPPGTTSVPCQVTVPVLTPALTITKTASTATAVPGQTVTYTVTVDDSGQTLYTGATVADSLAGLLDDAAYNNNATASIGTVSYASPDLTWAGTLAPGAIATITYTVTVTNPDTGDHILTDTVTSAEAGSNCPASSTDPRCTATVTVSQLLIDFTVSAGTVTPGGALVYTATLTNTGQTPYFGISVGTDTTGLAANATSAGTATATSGTLSIGATGTVWTGDIPVGGTVIITSPVRVNNPVTSGTLTATAVSTAPGNNCPPGSTDPRCTPVTQILTPALSIVTTANTTAAVPGQTVTYTVTVTDNGQTPYTGATVTNTLNLLGDASYNNDASATSGTVSYASPVITWTGDLAVGASAVITYTVTVNSPDTGAKSLNTVAASTDPGSSCPPASSNAGCSLIVPVLTPALTIAKTASTATATPGQTVTYTVTVTDSGQTPYSGAAFSDSLSGVLADASYNNNVAATSGSVSYASPVVSWSGDLAVGASAVITYTVTVNNPDTDGHILTNSVTSATAGNNCPAASTDPRCTVTVEISVLSIVNTASVSTVAPGAAVPYTLTITNTGQTPYTGVSVTDSLSGVLDDAAFNGDATTTAGSVTYVSPNLTWTGNLAPGASAIINFSVTVNSPDTGDKSLISTVTSAAAGNNCPAGGADPSCTATVGVLTPVLTITKTASTSTTTPGSAVGYTITVADTGQTSYAGATVTDDLTSVLGDSAYNGDAAATIGTVTYASPVLTWTGDLSPGDTATITYSVTVANPDTGDKHMVNTAVSTAAGSTCPPGGTNPACTTEVTDLIPALAITKIASVASATPGSAVDYTITVADTGQTPYTGAQVTDSLAGVLGDATYNSDATASAGTVGYASPTLTWTGDLALGEVVTIGYSVTVNNPDTGVRILANTVISPDPGSDCQTGSTDPRCNVTVPVMAGTLSMTAPVSADLGMTEPGGSASASLGTVQVTDNRGFGADWTATVSATAFTTGNGTAPETIPASDAFYDVTGLGSTTGSADFSVAPETNLSGDPQPVVSATNVGGNTSATWDPVIDVHVPATAVAGQYTATITHSVS
jgi:large repetitive protein